MKEPLALYPKYICLSLMGLLLAGISQSNCDSTPAGKKLDSAEDLVAGFQNLPPEARPSIYWLWLNGYVNRAHVERELKSYHDAGISGVCIFDMGARGDENESPPAGPAFMSSHSLGDIVHSLRVAGRLGMDVQLSVASSWDMGGSWVEPGHASMGLFHSQITIDGPAEFDDFLPQPSVPPAAPRDAAGEPVYRQRVAVLALPAHNRLPGHDFIFQLDPPGLHTLDHCNFFNSGLDPAEENLGPYFTKEFSIAVSRTDPTEDSFKEVFRSSLKATTESQRFQLPTVEARYVRLRLINGHNLDSNRLQLAEFELFDAKGNNLVASHEADRSRDGGILIGRVSARGQDGEWAAANIHDGGYSGASDSWSSDGPPPLVVERLKSIIDLTDRVEPGGRLRWNVPEGPWDIMVFDCLNTGERLKVPSPNSDGLATDHLSREATRGFLDHLIGRLESELGDLERTALTHLYLASYEVRGPIWTPQLSSLFRQYRGYDLIPYLPALSGNVVVDQEVTGRFIYDYRKTLGELLVDAYYREAVEVAHEAGIGIESEAGGPGPPIHQVPVDALKALGTIDEVRGEFWPRRPKADRMWVVKETASAAHIYGKRRVHMEAFTSMHHWQDGPFELKPSADRAFCEGANHFVWHTASHLPPEAGQPGWVYLAGTHLNTNLIWWSKARPFLDYLARCSFLLQQGLFVGDVCYYYGDQGYNFVPPKHVDPSLGFGYDYDVTNREVILTRMAVSDGRITLPDGMSYELLVLPERRDIDLEVLRKIEEFVRQGATVVGPKPEASTGLSDYPAGDLEVQQIAERLWGACDGVRVLENPFGRGRVVCGRALRDVLTASGVGPDFSYSSSDDETELDFIHRRTDEADIYFVRNKRPNWEQVEANFRVQGKLPEIWEPDSGLIKPQYEFRISPKGVALPIQLDPYGSVFVVFREATSKLPALDLVEQDAGSGAEATRLDGWDGQKAKLTVFRSGTRRIGRRDSSSVEFEVEDLPDSIALQGPWEVQFKSGPGTVVFEDLFSWTEHGDEKVRYFSGVAEYHREFEVPTEWFAANRRILLDLGELWAIAEVFLNDESLGVLWKPPFVLDVTSVATVGRNHLTVEVANTWSNRLVGDSRLPANQRVTRTNVLNSNGTPWKDVPLLRSGLFGPVRLCAARSLEVSIPSP